MNARERKFLAMSLRNARHRVVTQYIDPDQTLYLVQMSSDALDEIVRLLDEAAETRQD